MDETVKGAALGVQRFRAGQREQSHEEQIQMDFIGIDPVVAPRCDLAGHLVLSLVFLMRVHAGGLGTRHLHIVAEDMIDRPQDAS